MITLTRKWIEKYLEIKTGGKLKVYKGDGYFYFDCKEVIAPKSIMAPYWYLITIEDLDDAIEDYFEKVKEKEVYKKSC